jgi:hypothetical protein
MVSRRPIPELDHAIETYAQAFMAGDRDGAEGLVAAAGLESHRAATAAAADKRPLDSFEVLARAKIGFQQIAKVCWNSPGAKPTFKKVLLQIRWSQQADNSWKIIDVEDLTVKRSPWADIPPLAAVMGSGNGNA